MKKLLILALVAFAFTACNNTDNMKKVLIKTKYGDMKVKLYNETPKHRDNFVKLVEEGFYDSLIFHRVINEFMIQGGDPDSKGAKQGARLGNGGPGYQIDAEFNNNLLHKRGALAAARQGDQMNPEKKSSGSQFYIVHGKPFTDEELDQMEDRMNMQKKNVIFRDIMMKEENAGLKAEFDSIRQAQNREAWEAFINDKIEPKIEEELVKQGKFEYTEEQREVYKSVGGTPFLDTEYTVFGEIYEGLQVIDSIAVQKTDQADRPEEDIIMEMTIID